MSRGNTEQYAMMLTREPLSSLLWRLAACPVRTREERLAWHISLVEVEDAIKKEIRDRYDVK